MKSIIFAVVFLAFAFAFDSASAQFYVDIEHSLPRIGKRGGEGEFSNSDSAANLKEFLINRKLAKQQSDHEEMEAFQKELFYSAARTLQLVRMLNRNLESKK